MQTTTMDPCSTEESHRQHASADSKSQTMSESSFSASFLRTSSRAFAAGWLRIHSAAR